MIRVFVVLVSHPIASSLAILSGEAIERIDSSGVLLAVDHADQGSLSRAGAANVPDDVLEDSVVAAIQSDGTDQVAELVEEPGELDGALLSLVVVELNSIHVILVGNGVLVGVAPQLALSAVEGLSLADDLNEGLLGSEANDLDVIVSVLINVHENIIALGVIIALDDIVNTSIVGVDGEVHVSIAGNMTLGIGLLILDGVDLGKVSVDDDQTIAAVNLVVLELAALSTDHSLGGGSGVSHILGVLHAIGVGVNNSGGLLHTESLADVALRGLNVEGGIGSGSDLSVNGLVRVVLEILVAVLVPLGGGTAPDILVVSVGELEVLVAQRGLVELLDLIGLIAESRSVGHHGGLDSTEQHLGNELTGSRSAEVGGLGNVLQDTELLGILGNVQSPVSAGELTVLVVTDSAEDHGEDFIAGDLAGRLEGTIGIALDQLSVGAVADVTGSPTGTGHVAELVVGGIQAGLVALSDVAGVDTIDDRSHLSAGDVARGLEGTILITLEHTHAIENGNSLSVIGADVLVILEGAGADGQRQSHDQSQHHCE